MPKSKLPATKTEPALVRGVVIAVLSLLATLGVGWAADVSKDTIASIVLVASVLIPLIQAAWTRYAVTANAKVLARVATSSGQVVAGDASTVVTGEVLRVHDEVGASVVTAPVDPGLLR